MLTKTRLQWRGRDRQLLRKLKTTLEQMRDRDERMTERAADLGVLGFYFGTTANGGVDAAMTTLSNRIANALVARA